MNFFTPVEIEKSSFSIDYTSKLVFIGSCFAENISKYFENAKFQCLVNPTGILYNPLSISMMIENVLSGKRYSESDFFFDGALYNSYDFHGRFSSDNLQTAVIKANNSMEKAYVFFKTADVVFITLGTAFVYFLKETSLPVANCHKQLSEKFSRRLISVSEVENALKNIVENLQNTNKNIQIVFTISPLRHFRDGAHNNNLSKSTLHLGTNFVIKNYEFVHYFPSYEIVMDELRDYRFYEKDMVHLSETSEEYIWQKIKQTYFSDKVSLQVERVEKFMKSVNHRIENPFSLASKAFFEKNIFTAKCLESEIQGLNLEKEKEYFYGFLK
ncbi:MAG: GSCFA domain-containing protein [Bacteroidales bacterium]|nr:GSCFA domain-containing protein [Bacteroidales bacterium]